MTTPKLAAAPSGARTDGRKLWKAVLQKYELEQHELALLREAVRLVDLLDLLHAATKRDGAVIVGPDQPRTHPAAVEARQSRIALSRVLAVLRLPKGDEGDVRRPQRRSGARGVYAYVPGWRGMRLRAPADPPTIRLQLIEHYRRSLAQTGHRRVFNDGAVTVSPASGIIAALDAGLPVEVYGHVLWKYRRDVKPEGRYRVDADGTLTPIPRKR